jgi:hypothetical protein
MAFDVADHVRLIDPAEVIGAIGANFTKETVDRRVSYTKCK